MSANGFTGTVKYGLWTRPWKFLPWKGCEIPANHLARGSLAKEKTMGQIRAHQALNIDPQGARDTIGEFLHQELVRSGKRGFVLGFSGGVDSSLVAALSVEVTSDPSWVHCLYMPDFHTDPALRRRTRELARRFGFQFLERDITEMARREGAFGSPILRLLSLSGRANRALVGIIQRLLWALLGRTAYELTLEARKDRGQRGTIFHQAAWQVEESFNIRHRIRRRILERYSRENELLPLGCANRSEYFIGWFVKDGIDDLPIEPILGLYKTQVNRIARDLGVLSDPMRIAPSPDMIKGLNDELCIGLTYEKLDLVAFAVEHGMEEESLTDCGLSYREIRSIKRLHHLTSWKRTNPHRFPPI